MSSPASAVSTAAVTRSHTPATQDGEDNAAEQQDAELKEEELPEKLRFLLAQSSIYAKVIAEKLAKDTEVRRKRDEAASKRAVKKETKDQGIKQVTATRETRRGRTAGNATLQTEKPKVVASSRRAKREPSLLSSEEDSESEQPVKVHDFQIDDDNVAKKNASGSGSTPTNGNGSNNNEGRASRSKTTSAGNGKAPLSAGGSRVIKVGGKKSDKPTKPSSRSSIRAASSSSESDDDDDKDSGDDYDDGKKKGKGKNGSPSKSKKTDEILSDEDEVSGDESPHQPKADPEAPSTTTNGADKSLQPSLVTGATMKSYQVAGMEWLISLYENGLNGILADEMGLGKTLQTIAFLAYLRGKGVWGPFLVCCPLSTLANWVNEFERFTPSIPVILYHGTPAERATLRAERMAPPVDDKSVKLNTSKGKKKGKTATPARYRNTTETFPIIVTSYELVINDRKFLAQYDWKYLIIDESHRIKNLNCKLIRELMSYKSANRLLLTGTPLQNNLEELWSLLHFLMPEIFNDLDSFKSWFDIDVTSESTASYQIVSKLHDILKPFLLRRIKRDVEKSLPPKKEYLLSAPLTTEQKKLYDAVVGRQIRDFLLAKKEVMPETETPHFTDEEELEDEEEQEEEEEEEEEEKPKRGRGRPAKGMKRKAPPKSSGSKTASPAPAAKRSRPSYVDETETDFIKSLDDGSAHLKAAQFEKQRFGNNITMEGFGKITGAESDDEDEEMDEETKRANKAAKSAATKINRLKLSNMVMQLRKVVNHPWLFDWPVDTKTGEHILDDRIISSSGKMMLLERLLEELFRTGHKVLVFSQFTTQLDIIEDWAVDWKNWPICRIDGHTKQEDRRSQLKDFNERHGPDSTKLFLLSTRSGGVGINLTGADTVILFDSDWNPQMDLQAMDRVHRLGQKSPVLIFRLVTANTIEAKMLERAGNKRKLEALVIGSGKYTTSLDDLQDIFSGNASKATSGSGGEKAGGIAASMFADEMRDQSIRSSGTEKGKEKEIRVIKDGEEVISKEQLAKLLDRSDEAMTRGRGWKAEEQGSKAFEVIETVAAGGEEDAEKDTLADLFKNEESAPGTPNE